MPAGSKVLQGVTVFLVESLLGAIVRLEGDALVMHVGEKPYVVTTSSSLDAFRGPLAWGQVELATKRLTVEAVSGMLNQLLPLAERQTLTDFGAIEYEMPPIESMPGRFTVIAARGGEDIWLEIRYRRPPRTRTFEPPRPTTPAAVAQPKVARGEAAPPAPAPAIEPPLAAPAPLAAPVVEAPPLAETLPVVTAGPAPAAEVVPAPQPPVTAPPPSSEPEVPAVAAAPVVAAPPVTPAKPAAAVAWAVERAAPREAVPHEAVIEIVEDEAQEEVTADALAALVPVVPPEVVAHARAEPAAEAVAAPPVVAPAPPAAVEEVVYDLSAALEAGVHAPQAPVAPAAPSAARPPRLEAVPLAEVEPARPSVVVPLARPTVRVEAAAPGVRHSTLDRWLRLAAARGASALYVVADSRPAVRVDGEIQMLDSEDPPGGSDVAAMLMELLPEPTREAAPTEWVRDVPGVGRVRCMSFRDHRGPGGIFRMLPARALSVEQLGLSRTIQALCNESEGLVLVTGPRVSGKTTLVSAFVDLINGTRADHVITLESQIVFVHESRRSFVSQRELRGTSDEVAAAAREALREDRTSW